MGRPVGTIYQKCSELGFSIRRKDEIYLWKAAALGAARDRAKKKGIPFEITHLDIPENESCPILGVVLDYKRRYGLGQSNRHDATAELDRIIPSLGYVKGNIDVISALANRAKSDATEEVLVKIIEYLRKHKDN